MEVKRARLSISKKNRDYHSAMAPYIGDAQRLLNAGLAERTRKQGISKVNRWITFCKLINKDPFEAPELAYLIFASQLAREGFVKNTIQSYFSAIRSWLTDNGIAISQSTNSLRLKRMLRGVDFNPLDAPQKPKRLPKLPITIPVLLSIRENIDINSWNGSLLWFTCLIGTLGLLRSGEFSVVNDLSRSERDRRMLRLNHLSVVPDNSRLRLLIPVTKTQPKNGIIVHYAAGINKILCPIEAWRRYESIRSRQAPITMNHPDAPLLLTDKYKALTRNELIKQLRRVLIVAGLSRRDAKQFSGHSFRRGGAQSLRDSGASIDEIKIAGHWLSDAVLRYLTTNASTANRLAPLFARSAEIHLQSLADSHLQNNNNLVNRNNQLVSNSNGDRRLNNNNNNNNNNRIIHSPLSSNRNNNQNNNSNNLLQPSSLFRSPLTNFQNNNDGHRPLIRYSSLNNLPIRSP
jgi:integrase